MKQGVGLSRSKDLAQALAEASRSALQNLKALKADFYFVVYTYDHGLDPGLLSGILKRQFRDTPHVGWSSWTGWTSGELFEAESGVMVLAIKDLPKDWEVFRVYSVKEKQGLWAAEMLRHLDLKQQSLKDTPSSLFLVADSINFQTEEGFERLIQDYPHLKTFGFGASYGIPQCSLIANTEIYSNAVLGILIPGVFPWTASIQNIRPESERIHINRMSENLVIEIDEKPAFYRLSEHLMQTDDLPMMSPDEFRKHMGNMYIVEKYKESLEGMNHVGDSYRVVSLLGSEMTTGMVAVGDSLNFSREHFLAQKKASYAEGLGFKILEQVKEKLPNPSMIWMMGSSAHLRDKDRKISDMQLVKSVFPNAPIFGIGTHAEYIGNKNTQSCVVVAFD